jgi:Mrp family chromosome partitioning ATPase
MLTEYDEARIRELQRRGQFADPGRARPPRPGLSEHIVASRPLPAAEVQYRPAAPTAAREVKRPDATPLRLGDAVVDLKHLQSKRVVAYDATDQRARPYDMLRTQVLRAMSESGWKVLGVTSPTPGCGKTTTAINLAFSVARQPDHSVLLADMDLQRGQIANFIGVTPAHGGMLGLLEGRATLQNAAVSVSAGGQKIMALPTDTTKASSELMGSSAVNNLLQDFRSGSDITILDLPPILRGDDAMAVLPHVDCVLLVVAVGNSRMSEIEECYRYLQSTHIVRVVVNKTMDAASSYSY